MYQYKTAFVLLLCNTWLHDNVMIWIYIFGISLQWRFDGHDHQLQVCLPNRLFRRRSKKTSNLSVTGLCVGNSAVTGEFSAKKATNAESVSLDDVIIVRGDSIPKALQFRAFAVCLYAIMKGLDEIG